MKTMSGKIPTNAYYSRLLEWGRLISVTGLAQLLVQALGLISGILIIRLLPTKEYALYTLANTMLATVTVLADSGIGAGTLAAGGKVWQDSQKLGQVIITGIHLRRKFALLTLLISTPILIYLLLRHGASWLMALGIAASMIPAFYAALSDTLFEVPLKLHQDITALQKNQVFANCTRFILLLTALLFFPFTFVAMLAGGVTRLWANIKLKKLALKFTDLNQEEDQQVRKDIQQMLKRTIPSTIYYCASSQITIWLISIFGNTESIAQVGALERIAGVLSIVAVMFSTLVIPRFARLPEQSGVLIIRFFQIFLLLLLISTVACSVVYFLPEPVLYILGKKYQHLEMPLLLVTVCGCIVLISGIVNYLSVARGWAISPVLHISVSILTQILLIYFMDLSRLTHVLVLSIISALVGLVLYCGYFLYRSFQLKSAYGAVER
ncbi:polysaccharide biosynthesis protein [Pedobacter sp. HMWF019]|uniref:polysaccharide biosynthesis protein n=1 Tax=Pedobacter sp. HMWF019 TaxID=2056856 RepID=UPI000D395411|nr:polysaccharide biosynthesis protein [Pedobacter sp. HMWF019]PTT02659.1 polysaccharide biosynthesis protein [Pedobacter sp. HMWF019]